MKLTPEHEALKRTIQRWITDEINPHVDDWEAAGIFPAHQVFKRMGQLDLLGLNKPTAFGGMGLEGAASIIYRRELEGIDDAEGREPRDGLGGGVLGLGDGGGVGVVGAGAADAGGARVLGIGGGATEVMLDEAAKRY